MKRVFIPNEKAMLKWGGELAKDCKPGVIIFLEGQLGAGKTTIVRGLLEGLGYRGKVKSPTYSLVESYLIPNHCQIFHFDLYRLNNPQELLDIGWEDYLAANAILLIEWPEKAQPILPVPSLCYKIEIPTDGSGRIISNYK